MPCVLAFVPPPCWFWWPRRSLRKHRGAMRPPHAPHHHQVTGRMAGAVMAAHPMKALTKTDIARHPHVARRQMAKARRKVKATNPRRPHRRAQAKTASVRHPRPLAVVKAASPPKVENRPKATDRRTVAMMTPRASRPQQVIKNIRINQSEQHPLQSQGVLAFKRRVPACWQKYHGQPVQGQPPV